MPPRTRRRRIVLGAAAYACAAGHQTALACLEAWRLAPPRATGGAKGEVHGAGTVRPLGRKWVPSSGSRRRACITLEPPVQCVPAVRNRGGLPTALVLVQYVHVTRLISPPGPALLPLWAPLARPPPVSGTAATGQRLPTARNLAAVSPFCFCLERLPVSLPARLPAMLPPCPPPTCGTRGRPPRLRTCI